MSFNNAQKKRLIPTLCIAFNSTESWSMSWIIPGYDVYHYTPLSNNVYVSVAMSKMIICISCNSLSSCCGTDAWETYCCGAMDWKGAKMKVASFALKQEQSIYFVQKQDTCQVRTEFRFIVEQWLVTWWMNHHCAWYGFQWNRGHFVHIKNWIMWSLKDPQQYRPFSMQDKTSLHQQYHYRVKQAYLPCALKSPPTPSGVPLPWPASEKFQVTVSNP